MCDLFELRECFNQIIMLCKIQWKWACREKFIKPRSSKLGYPRLRLRFVNFFNLMSDSLRGLNELML